MQGASGFRAFQGGADLGDDVSGIQLPDNVHDGDARFCIAGFDGGLDAGRSTVARQEGGMCVDAAHGRHINHFLAQNLPVRHDDDQIRIQSPEVAQRIRAAQGMRLEHGNARFPGNIFDGRGCKHLVPADRAVGLRDQACQVRVTDQAAEGGNGNVACAHEDDAHGWKLALTACAGQC